MVYKIEDEDSNKNITFLQNVNFAFSKIQEAMDEEASPVNEQVAL